MIPPNAAAASAAAFSHSETQVLNFSSSEILLQLPVVEIANVSRMHRKNT